MKLLPILWSEPPTQEDWDRLSAAKKAIGYTDLIQPCQALQGSPGTILVIGSARPDWLCNFYACNDITDEDELQWALEGALNEDQRMETFEELLSGWMGAEVKYVNEEEYDNGVRFE